MPKFRKRPVVIEAVQFLPDVSNAAMLEHLEGCKGWQVTRDGIQIPTLEGTMTAAPGDWVIRGVKGEYYPCKPDIFEATYEPAGLGQEWVPKVTTQDAPDLPVLGAGKTTAPCACGHGKGSHSRLTGHCRATAGEGPRRATGTCSCKRYEPMFSDASEITESPEPAAGKTDAMPEWVRDGVATARGPIPNDRAPYHHIYIWLADALDRTLDKLECAEHERDEARLDLAAERQNFASMFNATHQTMCEIADDLTQAREEIEERAHSERNLVDLQQEQHKEIVALRKSLGEAQLVIEQQDRDYRRVTAEQELPAAAPDEPEHDPNRCIGSRWD